MSLFKKKPGTVAPIPPALPAHPVQRFLSSLLTEIETGISAELAKSSLPSPNLLLAQSGAKMARSWVSTISPEQCVKILTTVNHYNASLCYECGIEPERIERSEGTHDSGVGTPPNG